MAIEFEFLSPDDKPALLALNTPELLSAAQLVLGELGYKVRVTDNHEDFLTHFHQVQYHVVIIEELFAATTPAENHSLISLQNMLVSQRRHAVIVLIGGSFQSLNPMHAFQQSVHAVVNPAEIYSLSQIIQKVVSENNLFLNVYRTSQLRALQSNT